MDSSPRTDSRGWRTTPSRRRECDRNRSSRSRVRGKVDLPMDRSNLEERIGSRNAPHAHVMDVDTRGSAAVAESLARRGLAVSGSLSDARESQAWLAPRGVSVREGTNPRWLTNRTRLLVHGPEVERHHPLRLGASRRGVHQQTPAQWLAEQLTGRRGWCSPVAMTRPRPRRSPPGFSPNRGRILRRCWVVRRANSAAGRRVGRGAALYRRLARSCRTARGVSTGTRGVNGS